MPIITSLDVPNAGNQSKIVATTIIAAVVNILVYFGVIPQAVSGATIELVNTIFFGLIGYFRLFATVSPAARDALQQLASSRK